MLITDYRYINEGNIGVTIGEAIKGGVDLIQYRDKEVNYSTKLKRCRLLRELTTDLGAGLVVNSDIDLAEEVGADGLHIPSNMPIPFLPRLQKTQFGIIGFSVHNEEELRRAEKAGADYLLVSPLFKPGSKVSSMPAIGEEGLSRLCGLTSTPIFALGGINEANIGVAIKSGVYGVASVTGLLCSKDIYGTARRMREAIESGKGNKPQSV